MEERGKLAEWERVVGGKIIEISRRCSCSFVLNKSLFYALNL